MKNHFWLWWVVVSRRGLWAVRIVTYGPGVVQGERAIATLAVKTTVTTTLGCAKLRRSGSESHGKHGSLYYSASPRIRVRPRIEHNPTEHLT